MSTLLQAWDARYPGVLDGLGILGGGANVIMQLSWPAVGYGVKESRVTSGSILHHPVKRLRTTITYLAVALAGDEAERQAYRAAVGRVHAQVVSTAQSPVTYRALDPQLQLWVAACLYQGFVLNQRYLRGQDLSQDEGFYQAMQVLGSTLQARAELWPEHVAAFHAYWSDGLARAHIDDTMRHYLTGLIELRHLPWPLPQLLGRFNRFVTTGYLPPALRVQMHFDWSARDERRFRRLLRLLGACNRWLPRPLRQGSFVYVLWDLRRRLRRGQALV